MTSNADLNLRVILDNLSHKRYGFHLNLVEFCKLSSEGNAQHNWKNGRYSVVCSSWRQLPENPLRICLLWPLKWAWPHFKWQSWQTRQKLLKLYPGRGCSAKWATPLLPTSYLGLKRRLWACFAEHLLLSSLTLWNGVFSTFLITKRTECSTEHSTEHAYNPCYRVICSLWKEVWDEGDNLHNPTPSLSMSLRTPAESLWQLESRFLTSLSSFKSSVACVLPCGRRFLSLAGIWFSLACFLQFPSTCFIFPDSLKQSCAQPSFLVKITRTASEHCGNLLRWSLPVYLNG